MANRETIFYDIPKEWRENAKKGLCPVCGKHRAEFQKFMRVYCSPEHRDEYNSRIYTWQSFREKILLKRGEKCEHCGLDKNDISKNNQQKAQEDIKQWVKDHQAEIELERKDILDRVEKMYREAMDDDHVIRQALPYELRSKVVWQENPKFEVDHKIAIVNGGEMFDEENVQVLCQECHQKKTTQDIREHKRNKKHQEVLCATAP